MTVKLNDKQVKGLLRKKECRRFAVGNGLYFRITDEASGFWVIRYSIHGKRRELTLVKCGVYEGEFTLKPDSQLKKMYPHRVDKKILIFLRLNK